MASLSGTMYLWMRWTALALASAGLLGCATVKMPEPSSSIDTVEKLRAAQLAPATTGKFALAPGKNASMDTSVTVRASSLASSSGSFAQELKDQIITDLKAAAAYDATSTIVIEGLLTDSMVDAAIGTGTARVAARFSVTRAGNKVYDKELAVDAKWESSFLGAVAIPMAVNQYSALYKILAAKLFDDADFHAALKR